VKILLLVLASLALVNDDLGEGESRAVKHQLEILLGFWQVVKYALQISVPFGELGQYQFGEG
jgi:hypothetical protein